MATHKEALAQADQEIRQRKGGARKRGEPSLHDVLRAHGFTTKRGGGQYAKHVLRDGQIVFTGTADEVWSWLREEGFHLAPPL